MVWSFTDLDLRLPDSCALLPELTSSLSSHQKATARPHAPKAQPFAHYSLVLCNLISFFPLSSLAQIPRPRARRGPSSTIITHPIVSSSIIRVHSRQEDAQPAIWHPPGRPICLITKTAVSPPTTGRSLQLIDQSEFLPARISTDRDGRQPERSFGRRCRPWVPLAPSVPAKS